MSERKFVPLTHTSVDYMYSSGFLKKGALVKYRLNTFCIADYGLDPTENEWCHGLISETLWYVNVSMISVYPDKESVCYDLSVHNVSLGSKEMINIELYEILILISE